MSCPDDESVTGRGRGGFGRRRAFGAALFAMSFLPLDARADDGAAEGSSEPTTAGALAGADAAQGAAPAPELSALLDQALERYREEDYRGALVLLRRLYALDQNPGVLYNLAATHAALGHCDEARSAYQLYLEQSRSESGRRDAERQLEALGDCSGTTATPASGAGGDSPEVAAPSRRAPSLASPVSIAPNPTANAAPALETPASPKTAGPSPVTAPYLQALPVEPGPSAARVAAWVAIGAGGALALASAGFAYASARADDEDERQPLAQSGDRVAEVQSNGRRYNTLAWGFAGGAAALTASGVLLLAFEPTPSTALGLAAPASGPLSLTLRHTF